MLGPRRLSLLWARRRSSSLHRCGGVTVCVVARACKLLMLQHFSCGVFLSRLAVQSWLRCTSRVSSELCDSANLAQVQQGVYGRAGWAKSASIN